MASHMPRPAAALLLTCSGGSNPSAAIAGGTAVADVRRNMTDDA